MIAAVTGATGYVGRFIVKKLIDEGLKVRAWRRPSSDFRGLPETIEWVEGALGAPEAADALVGGADMLVHVALDHAPGRYRGGEGDDVARFWQLNVDGSAALLRTARAAGIKRALVFSSRAVFGGAAAGSLGDDDKPSPDSHYGAVKAELEAFVKKFSAGWPVAVLRPTGIYGIVEPVERSKWFSLVNAVYDGVAVPPRTGTEVHGQDVASAAWALLSAPPERISGRAFNCSDIVVSHRDIVRLVQALANIIGPLPEEGEPPQAIMRPDGLKALGVTFGGPKLFERTIAELVSAAQERR